MKRIDIAPYARLASALNKVININADYMTANPKIVGTELIYLQVMLEDFIKTEINLGEVVPKRIVELQGGIATYLEKWKSPSPQIKFNNVQHFMEYKILETSAQAAATVLFSVFPQKPTFFVCKKSGYDTNDLIDNGMIFVDKEVASLLPQNAIDDINQGVKALAFELWTASGFHLARAVETVLLMYHKVIVKTIPSQRNWGAYIRELRAAKGDKKTIDSVDSFREHHRNPITHPEILLSESEAISLFPMAIHVINVLMAEIDANGQNPKGLVKKIFGK